MHRSPPEDDRTRVSAFGFIIRVADRIATTRPYIAEPEGIPFVLARLRDLAEHSGTSFEAEDTELGKRRTLFRRYWRLVELVSSYAWGVEILIQCNKIGALMRSAL